MRFEQSFEYKISIDEQLYAKQFTIPSMLIQPCVENAIKHGLLHRKTNRILLINFSKVDNYIKIEINDNGIGRKRSGELQAEKTKGHASFTMRANQSRLEILKSFHQDVSLEIIDKTSNLGEANGTKVVIMLHID